MMIFLYTLAAIAFVLIVLANMLENSIGRQIHRNSQSRLPSKVPPSGPTTHGEDTTRAAVGGAVSPKKGL